MDWKKDISFEEFKKQIAFDYFNIQFSREISLLCRKEVLRGKSTFAISGDGKELPQMVLARYFQKGDFRAGYYRDQTWMLACGIAKAENIFAQVYGITDAELEPFCGGRQMCNHFATPFVNEKGEFHNLTERYNITCDIAPTASQMTRSVGLALASKLFRENKALHAYKKLSNKGNEVCFCTIGDASTSEGHFWEAVNAAAIIQMPMVILVWDDGYGISVPTKLQTVKGSISDALSGIQIQENTNGVNIFKVNGWDYVSMHNIFHKAIQHTRQKHIPAIIHVTELTQPLGHSTSGSHERYKSKERLQWEKEWDCNLKFKQWILESKILTQKDIDKIEKDAAEQAEKARSRTWDNIVQKTDQIQQSTLVAFQNVLSSKPIQPLELLVSDLKKNKEATIRKSFEAIRRAKYFLDESEFQKHFADIHHAIQKNLFEDYNTKLYFEQKGKTYLDIKLVPPVYDKDPKSVNGYEILNEYFDQLFATNPLVITFGEDVGKIGDVNQGFSGLQEKYGKDRIMDTGIREMTIMGQGIGLAMRGFRPIAEIQYLDYLIYGLQALVDDASTTHYRTKGQQICPIIVRTRGHRLVGIWHSGSPMGMILNSIRGFILCVPRNMTQSVGLYNALLKTKDPSILIECLNGYRLKETLPSNLLDMTIPLGVPEILRQGTDITIVSYGSVLRIIETAADILHAKGINCEIIDVQTLLPFDVHHSIVESLKKTNRILFVDEDVPGGATAFMFQQVIELQQGYKYLDCKPKTLTSKEHRPAYGVDGDYVSKPNIEDVVDTVLQMMSE